MSTPGRLLAAEVRKLRTTRMVWGLLALAVLFVVLTVVATLATAGQEGAADLRTTDGVKAVWASMGGATPLVLVLGVVIVTTEYRHGTITGTFLATPQRWRVLLAKVVTGALAGFAFAVLSILITAAVAIPWLATLDDDVTLGVGEIAAVVGAGAAALALWGAIGAGVGALIRNQVAAIVVVLVWTSLVEGLLVAFLPEVGRWLPGGAASAVTASGVDELLAPWAGGLVFVGYVVLVTVAAIGLTERRDVT